VKAWKQSKRKCRRCKDWFQPKKKKQWYCDECFALNPANPRRVPAMTPIREIESAERADRERQARAIARLRAER